MKDTWTFVIFVTFVFVLSLSGAALAAGNNQAGQPQTPALPGKQAPQAVQPAPVAMPTPPVAPKSPNVRPGQPQQSQTQKDMLLKMSEDRKRQEKEREKQLKDARTVQVAPSKGNAPSTGKSAQNNSLNRTAIDLGR
jgi:outer membrane biosynthesis protein TonB